MRLQYIIILVFIQTIAFGQVFIELNGVKINCDSAYTNFEMGLCSKEMLEKSQTEYKDILNKIMVCLDTLISEDKIYRQQLLLKGHNQSFEFLTDYVKIKNMLLESCRLFEKYAEVERDIEGEFYGIGRERLIAENMRLVQLYDNKIIELKHILEMHCG